MHDYNLQLTSCYMKENFISLVIIKNPSGVQWNHTVSTVHSTAPEL